MTAIRVGMLGTLAAAWLAVAALLWRTSVPRPRAAVARRGRDLRRARARRGTRRYEYVLTALWALQRSRAARRLCARPRARPRDLRGTGAVVSGALFGGGVFVLAWLVGLPFHLAAHWWRRRYERHRPRLRCSSSPAPGRRRCGELVLACLAGVALVAAGRLLGRRAWLGLWAAFVALAAAYVLLYPTLLAPRLRPLEDRALAAQIQALGRRAGSSTRRSRCGRPASARARSTPRRSAPARTTRVILWDTLLEPDVGRGEIRFVAAHELTHIARHHPWKGVAWFALLALPGTWLLARAVTLRRPARDPARRARSRRCSSWPRSRSRTRSHAATRPRRTGRRCG